MRYDALAVQMGRNLGLHGCKADIAFHVNQIQTAKGDYERLNRIMTAMFDVYTAGKEAAKGKRK